MYVRPSAWNNSAPTGRIFMKFDIWVFFENLSRKLKFYSNLTWLYMKTSTHLWLYLDHFFLEWEMLQTKVVEKIETHILCSINFSPTESRAIWEIMWKNIVRRDRQQMTIWRMRIACWVPKATDTHSEYVILVGCSTATVVTRTLLGVTLYVLCLPCWMLEL